MIDSSLDADLLLYSSACIDGSCSDGWKKELMRDYREQQMMRKIRDER